MARTTRRTAGYAVIGAGVMMGALAACSSDNAPSIDRDCASETNIAWDGCPASNAERLGDVGGDEPVGVVLLLHSDDAALQARLDEHGVARLEGRAPEYLSAETLMTLFGANPDAVSAVVDHLSAQGLDGVVDPTGTFVAIEGDAGDIERTFRTTFGRYRASGTDSEFVAADTAPTLPAELLPFVQALAGFNARSINVRSAGAGAQALDTATPPSWACSSGSGVVAPTSPLFSPQQLNEAYGVDKLQAGVSIPQPGGAPAKTVKLLGEGTRAAILSTALDVSDFHDFIACFGDYFDQTIDVVYHPPSTPPTTPMTAEGIMDLQAIVYAAPHVEQVDFWGVMSDTPAAFVKAFGTIIGSTPPPDVVSLSIGFSSATLRQTFNTLIAKGALRGTATFAASGDDGDQNCEGPLFSPSLTSVGGTQLTLSDESAIEKQVPTWLYFSEVSNVGFMLTGSCADTGFDQPSYQKGVPGGSSTSTSRSAPDVASVSQNAAIYAPPDRYSWFVSGSGNWMQSSGTSFAAPYTAGAALLLSQASKAAGKGGLGNVNDVLYQAAKTSAYDTYFADVTMGQNCPGTLDSSNPLCIILPTPISCFVPDPNCTSTAHQFFDEPSGLGSIKYDAIVNLVTRQE